MPGALHELSRVIGSIERAQQEASNDLGEFRGLLDRIAGQLTELSLDVKQDRAITAQERATLSAERQLTREKLERVDERLEKIEPVVTKEVGDIRVDVAELKLFRANVGKMVAIAGMLVTGAVYLLWQGIAAFSGDIKALFGRLFH